MTNFVIRLSYKYQIHIDSHSTFIWTLFLIAVSWIVIMFALLTQTLKSLSRNHGLWIFLFLTLSYIWCLVDVYLVNRLHVKKHSCLWTFFFPQHLTMKIFKHSKKFKELMWTPVYSSAGLYNLCFAVFAVSPVYLLPTSMPPPTQQSIFSFVFF